MICTSMTALLTTLLVAPWISFALETTTIRVNTPAAAAFGYVPNEFDHKWTAGVHKMGAFNEFEHICGGSLISAELILSAAHCFWNSGRAVPLNEYRMTVGNFLREYKFASNDTKEKIRDLVFHERYRGSDLNYAHDIAIVRLIKKVLFSSTVAPVNIDWRQSFKDDDLRGEAGTVVGWGYTEFDQPSFVRIAVNLPYVDFDSCWKTVPREFRAFITPDKFCAGLRNGTTVCPGDSGGGLVFFNSRENKWYIRGIVSVGVQPNDKSKCRKAQFTAFTSISSYRVWLQEKLTVLEQSSERLEAQTDSDVIVFPKD